MKPRPNLFKLLSGPEALFIIGTSLALLPYLTWYLEGYNVDYIYSVNYIPGIIYIAGLLFFLFGAWIIPRDQRKGNWSGRVMNMPVRWIGVLAVLCGIQAFYALRVYGGLPLLNYLMGSTEVGEINAMQADAAFGQLGLLTLSTFLLTAALLLFVIAEPKPRLGSRLVFTGCLCLIALIMSMAGKRQGLLMCLFFLFVGVSIRGINPIRRFLLFIGVPEALANSSTFRTFTVAVSVFVILAYITTLVALRTGATQFVTGVTGITGYLEVPLINFEYQSDIAGFGPYELSFQDLLIGLLPYRLILSMGGAVRADLQYPEPTASAGIYGPLHLCTGFTGCMVFVFLLGVFCKFLYVKAERNDLCLLLYAQCAWPLFVMHSFNLFLILLYVTAPFVALSLFYIILVLIDRNRRSPESNGSLVGG